MPQTIKARNALVQIVPPPRCPIDYGTGDNGARLERLTQMRRQQAAMNLAALAASLVGLAMIFLAIAMGG